jgi:hypothetical protein
MDGGYKATRGLEMLFHEASHTIADSLGAALRDISAQTGKAPPFGVLHAIIFFTAGELTRRAVVGYTPFAEAGGTLADRPHRKVSPSHSGTLGGALGRTVESARSHARDHRRSMIRSRELDR